MVVGLELLILDIVYYKIVALSCSLMFYGGNY